MAGSKKTLIRGAAIVSMDLAVGDLPSGDILIVDDRIADVGPSIKADDAEIVDATGMIASPGFVDTHRHVWQTQLKGVAIDWSLFDYSCLMRSMYSICYEPGDAYLGNYVGALDAINAGITSIVDHIRPHSSLGYRPPAPETASPPYPASGSASLHLHPDMAAVNIIH